MSFTLKDRILGRKLVLIYAADPHEQNRNAGLMARARAVRRHLARTKSSHLLHVYQSGAAMEMWWAAESAGQSFAAGIDAWLESRHDDPAKPPPPEDFFIVIPLDRRIYLAEIAQGMVRNERALEPVAAEEALQKHTTDGSIVYAFASGRQGELVNRYVPLEELPFEPHRYLFKRAVGVLARNGLPHPIHVAFTGVLAVLIAASFWYRAELRQFAFPDPAEQAAATPARVITPKVQYSAGADLRALARAIVMAEPLLGEGLQALEFTGRTVLYTGTADRGFPHFAKQVAAAYSGTWLFGADGWSIKAPVPGDPPIKAPAPPGDETLQVLLHHPLQFKLIAGPALVSSPGTDQNIRILPVAAAQFSAAPAAMTVADIADGAGALDGLPAQLTRASCRFRQHRLITCTLNVETRTL